MTRLLEQAFERVRTLPAETQDDLAAADEEIERGELASDEEVRTVFSKIGL